MSLAPVLLVLLFSSSPDAGALAAAVPATAPVEELAHKLQDMPDAERRKVMQAMSRQELDALVRASPPEALIQVARKAVLALGLYKVRLKKQERIEGELLEVQEIDAWVREEPFATRLEYVKGPNAGRRVLYNAQLSKDEMRVRESGILGLKAVWIGLDSSLAKGDSNHGAHEMGFSKLLAYLDKDLQHGKKVGGFKLAHEGFDREGSWCILFEKHKGAKGFYAAKARICSDLILGLPMKLEVWDDAGLLERFQFSNVEGNLKLAHDFFSLESAGL